MSRHHKKKHPPTKDLASPARVEKALRENRTQQALELARALYKQLPSNENKELLKKACLARARDLAAHGYTRDAGEVLGNAIALDPSPAFVGEIGKELARVGQISRALQLLPQIPDPAARAVILNHVADEAVRQGSSVKPQLPETLWEPLDATLQAFALAETGQDEAARAQLNAIGLRSPFLEWKLFVRGLLAYYQKDDARALENWQRLDAERLPFRLMAPLRFAIDQTFAANQPPETQGALQKQLDRLQSSVLIQQLRSIQAALANERQLPQAFRLTEQVLVQLRQAGPHLVPRLANCFYWAIIHHGMPEDMKRLERVFGKPPEDPTLARLEALALEGRGDFEGAHHFWQQFDKSVETNPVWPAEHKKPVRALIWWRMGKNADAVPDIDDANIPPFLRHAPGRPKPLKPGAEQCWERSLELAPDQLTTYEALLDHHLRKDDSKKAEKAARRLIERFPEHVPTLEKLGDLLMEQEKYTESLEFFQRAMRTNPLEQRLRSKTAHAFAYQARSLAEHGKFDDARQAFQAALSIDDRREKYQTLCLWAACEFKAGDTAKGEELLQQALGEKGNRLAVTFSLLIETIRFKLNKLKTRINKDFNALLDEEPTGAAAAALAETAAAQLQAGVKYHGQQTHEKKVLAYLEKAKKAVFTEREMRIVSASLGIVRKPKLQFDYIKLGQHQFHHSPHFYIAEAVYYSGQSIYGRNPYQASMALQKARQLAAALPRGDQAEVMEQINYCESLLQEMNPFGRMFGSLLDNMPFEVFDDGFDEEEDYEEDGFF